MTKRVIGLGVQLCAGRSHSTQLSPVMEALKTVLSD
jgi:hypothetical protein